MTSSIAEKDVKCKMFKCFNTLNTLFIDYNYFTRNIPTEIQILYKGVQAKKFFFKNAERNEKHI